MLAVSGCAEDTGTGSENKEQITLTYMVPGYGSNSYAGHDQLKKIEEKNPNIHFEVQVYSEEQYYAALKTRLATGRGTDLFFVQPEYGGANGVASLAKAGYLEPIEKLEVIKKNQGKLDDSYFLSCEGHVYSVSIGTMGLGVIYNKEVFADYNLELPMNWEEFLECCEVLKKQNIQPVVMSGKDANTLQYGIYQIAANRVYRRNPDFNERLREGKVHFTDTSSWDETLKMFTGLYDKGYLGENIMENASADAFDILLAEDAGMMFTGTGEAKRYMNAEENLGFFVLPAQKEDEIPIICKGEIGGISIYTKSKYKEQCKESLNDVYAEEIEDKTEQMEEFSSAFPDITGLADGNLYVPLCNQGWNNTVEHVLETMLGEYLSGGNVTVGEITEAMQKELEK